MTRLCFAAGVGLMALYLGAAGAWAQGTVIAVPARAGAVMA